MMQSTPSGLLTTSGHFINPRDMNDPNNSSNESPRNQSASTSASQFAVPASYQSHKSDKDKFWKVKKWLSNTVEKRAVVQSATHTDMPEVVDFGVKPLKFVFSWSPAEEREDQKESPEKKKAEKKTEKRKMTNNGLDGLICEPFKNEILDINAPRNPTNPLNAERSDRVGVKDFLQSTNPERKVKGQKYDRNHNISNNLPLCRDQPQRRGALGLPVLQPLPLPSTCLTSPPPPKQKKALGVASGRKRKVCADQVENVFEKSYKAPRTDFKNASAQRYAAREIAYDDLPLMDGYQTKQTFGTGRNLEKDFGEVLSGTRRMSVDDKKYSRNQRKILVDEQSDENEDDTIEVLPPKQILGLKSNRKGPVPCTSRASRQVTRKKK